MNSLIGSVDELEISMVTLKELAASFGGLLSVWHTV